MRKSGSGEKIFGKEGASKDRVVRVFVSSTFKDMIEDRNELMVGVWPALRKVCRGRAVEFVEVDLRWGVTEEQSQRKETLRHCLAEIKRCRPYFIGLLGERYGWTPGPEAFPPALLDEEVWLKNEVAKHSVTELEILHGVLNDPEMAGRAFFYFRDPQYAASKGGDYLPEDTARPTRQDTLKEKVRAVCQTKSIPLRENYADPRALAALVLKDLSDAIDVEFPPDQVPDVWSREDRDHEAYARSRRTDFYVGREAYFERLDTFARDGADGCGLTVLGASGGGKSALLANWVARWRQAHPNDFVFQHYIGSSAMSAGHLALMRRLMVAIIRWCGADDPSGSHGMEEEERKIPAQAEEIIKVFPEYLGRLVAHARRKGVGAVLVLDALNQIEDRDRGRLLAWLSHRLPGELRLIVSTLPGDTFDALQPRGWPALTVEPLTPDERVELIARYLKHFAQGLSDDRARRIAGVAAASNPLYIKTLLDDLRATGDHQKLDQQIADYLQAADIPGLLGKILARFERDYERDHPGLVRESLSLLWAARRGLTEPELLQALGSTPQSEIPNPKSKIKNQKSNPAPLPAALWSPVRCALEDGLVDRDGVLAFAHEHLRAAVERRYVPEVGTARALRLRLADDFAGRPVDARQADELPWLLRQAESRDRLRACLLDIDRFLLMHKREDNELLGYWVWLKEERAMGQPYVRAFEQWAGGKGETTAISYAANQLAHFLAFRAALHAEAEPLMRRALKIDEQSYGENHPSVARGLSNLAGLLQATSRLAEAEPLMRRALEIDEQSYGENHPSVAIRLNNLAGLLQATSRLAEAEPLFRRALTINAQNYGENHPNVAINLNNLAALFKDINRLAEAELLMRRVLKIDEQNFGEKHPSVAIDLNNLAMLLLDTSRFEEADTLMRRALTIDEQSYGMHHPEVARDLNNLTHLLQATNRFAEADPLMRRALKISEQCYEENNPTVAIRLSNLAQLLYNTDRFDEAEPLFRRALMIDEQSFAENNPSIATDLNNLGTLLHATNRFDEAEPLMRRALMIDEQNYRENHPSVARDLNNLAQLLKATNRLAEAEPLMRRMVEIFLYFTRATGHQHPHLQVALTNYANLLDAMGKPEDEILGTLADLAARDGLALGGAGG
ncbi:tetratricopeptide repeat protein [Oligosphaera ethanolica]|uniref:Tetratricopeptide (TPR) repeat protein n=1 Tax=Oligosphaera ethanolica TaxID=760260 RepID=A0AAE3VHD1_9BACT|nr:tetratricopeptide repeat protein [Oligosphaera ethanolica]MDQ0290537.1 tetratricopeptide (TPR) repeat protein [Oligosphaera ethanolica]